MRPTDITAIIAAIVGVAALVLSINNYLRDRPKIVVRLYWDWRVTDNTVYDRNKLWGHVEVANIGRRPVFIKSASLKLPKGYEHTHELIMESIRGQRLAEGDPPVLFMMRQDGMEKYAADWRKIRAVVSDSANREYFSKKLRKSQRPSWASRP